MSEANVIIDVEKGENYPHLFDSILTYKIVTEHGSTVTGITEFTNTDNIYKSLQNLNFPYNTPIEIKSNNISQNELESVKKGIQKGYIHHIINNKQTIEIPVWIEATSSIPDIENQTLHYEVPTNSDASEAVVGSTTISNKSDLFKTIYDLHNLVNADFKIIEVSERIAKSVNKDELTKTIKKEYLTFIENIN